MRKRSFKGMIDGVFAETLTGEKECFAPLALGQVHGENRHRRHRSVRGKHRAQVVAHPAALPFVFEDHGPRIANQVFDDAYSGPRGFGGNEIIDRAAQAFFHSPADPGGEGLVDRDDLAIRFEQRR
jgi:hypothetical protein